jgi:flagellar hook-basal body complex protein FliE
VIVPAIGIGPLGSGEWNVGKIAGAGTSAAAPSAAGQSGQTSFSNTLNDAINSLESSQNSASTASQQLATGQLSDPTQAVTTVENASLAMDFASQVRNQIDTAATTLFQTQV